jgi:hypothetical protein
MSARKRAPRDAWISWLEGAIKDPDGRDKAGAEILDWLRTKDELAGALAETKASIRRLEEASR